jgi:hypothetical protein
VIELSRDNPDIVFVFTFEYENENEFEKVGSENRNGLAGYRKIRKQTDSIRNISNTVRIRKNKLGAPTPRI